MTTKIAVAMSGGLDSSFAAYLLRNKGYEIVGLHMLLPKICSNDEQKHDDLEKVAKFLNIEIRKLDFKSEFTSKVINYFCEVYSRGKTPNPCAICNKYIKFGLLLDEAQKNGAEFLATGHYAKTVFYERKNLFFIEKGVDKIKDQSYFLSLLTQNQISKIKFPLGELTKKEVFDLAQKVKLPVSEKKESQEICFIPNNEYRDALKKLGAAQKSLPGKIVLSSGEQVGVHDGIINFTIGQRKGIGAHSKKMYVKEILPETNQIIIGEDSELFAKKCLVKNINWLDPEISKQKSVHFKAKIRYRNLEQNAEILNDGNESVVIFDKPQRAITPGQIMAFYDGERVVGGGFIENVIE